MSHVALAYIKKLKLCPDGFSRLSKPERVVAMVLADYYQDVGGAFPSVETITDESDVDRRCCQRILAALEGKKVAVGERPKSQGRGHRTCFRFPEFDAMTPEQRKSLLNAKGGSTYHPSYEDKGGNGYHPSYAERAVIFDEKGGKKGGKKGIAYLNNKEQRTKTKADLAQETLEIWNQHCGDSLPKAKKLGGARRKKLATRISEAESPEAYIADFAQAVKLCTTTPFLSGVNARRWTPDFDWLIENDINMVKVLEGKYGKPDRPPSSTSRSADPKAKLAEQLRSMGVPDSAIQGVAI